jgi:spermidine synthase
MNNGEARGGKAEVPPVPGGWLLPLLLVLFFLSGMTALIYQVLWLRLLTLVFGVTVYAASTVLGSFMSGLAIGSFLAGRFADRALRPLLWFAVAELLVGLSAIASPALLRGVESIYTMAHPALVEAGVPLTLVRFAGSFLVLVVPATMMGATLPLIVKSSLTAGTHKLGQHIGLLYGTNTAGAIAGTLLAGMYLVGGLGITASFRFAVGLNLAIAIAAAIAAWRLPVAEARRLVRTPTDPVTSPEWHEPVSERVRRLIMVVFVLSGFSALALEVVWFRVLVLFLPATTYAFTVMLATVLLGIALGSYLVTPLMRRRIDWTLALGAMHLLIAIAALTSFAALSSAHGAFEWVRPLARTRVAAEMAPAAVAGALAILPATILMGMAFPVGMRLFASVSSRTGAQVGSLYSLNVFGSIAGSIVAGFVLLPFLGSRWSIVLVSSVSAAGGLLLLSAASRRRVALAGSAIGLIVFVVTAVRLPDPVMVSTAHRHPGEHVAWYEEGIQTTVAVNRRASGRLVLYMDGLHQANDSAGMIAVHRQIGQLAVALHPQPTSVLVLGLGGGATPGAVADHPGISVDVVELSDTVVRSAQWFSHVNGDLLRRPNVRLTVDDGRNHLLVGRKRYDIVTADIIQPVHAGAGNLYSMEYFRLARGALQENGLMLQWVGLGSATQYSLIMRTFLSVFPHATLWGDGTLMVGSTRPLVLDRLAYEDRLADEQTRRALSSAGLGSFDNLLSAYVAGPDEMRAFVGPGPLLTDDRPMVEYFLSLPGSDRPVDPRAFRGDVARHIAVHPASKTSEVTTSSGKTSH